METRTKLTVAEIVASTLMTQREWCERKKFPYGSLMRLVQGRKTNALTRAKFAAAAKMDVREIEWGDAA